MRLIGEAGLRQALRWQTDVLPAYDGTEQRIRLASLPRVSFEGSIFFEDADLAAARTLLHATPEAAFNLPQPWEAVASANPITAAEVTVDGTYADWTTIGRSVYIRGRAGDAYTAEIDNVAGAGTSTCVLTLDTSVPAGTFAAGSTFVMPVEALLLEDGQGMSRAQRRVGMWQVRGRQSTARAIGTTGAPAMTTLDSLDLLDRRPLVEGYAAEQLVGSIDFQDAGGAVSSTASWAQAKESRTFSWTIRGASERQWWKQFLAAREGRRTSFLAPTWRPDLQLSTFTAGNAWIRIVASYADYLTSWWPSLAHRRIQVEFSNGTFQRRTVTAASNIGGGIQQLDLSANMTGDPADVVAVSFLELARLDTDEVSIEWDGTMQGRVTLPIVTIQG